MSIPIQPRRNTAALAAVSNPVLLMGEQGLETDTGKTKRGNGVTTWNLLPYDAPNQTVLSSTYAPVQNALAPHLRTPAQIGRGGRRIITKDPGADGWSFGSSNDATATLADATGVLGTCASMVSKGTGLATNLSKTGMAAMDFANNDCEILFRIPDMTHLKQTSYSMAMYLGNGGFASYYLPDLKREVTESRNIMPGEWYRLRFACEGTVAAGTPNRGAITDLQFQFFDDNTGNKVAVQVQSITMVPRSKTFPTAVVSLTYDDSWKSVYTNAMPKLAQYGYPGTVYPILDTIGDASHLSVADMKQMRDLFGWEIGSHAATTTNHNLTGGFGDLTYAAHETELAAMKKWNAENGFTNETFAYPRGGFTTASADQTRRYFSVARGFTATPKETLPPQDPIRLRCYPVGSPSNTLAAIQTVIDRAVAAKQWLILGFHEVTDTPVGASYVDLATHHGIVDYLATKGIPVMAVGDVMEALSAPGEAQSAAVVAAMPGVPTPADYGLGGWSIDSASAAVAVTFTAGVARGVRFQDTPGATRNGLSMNLPTAGVALANTYVAVYNSAGVRLGVSADCSTTLQGSAAKTVPMTAPFVVPADGTIIATLQTGSATTLFQLTGGAATLGNYGFPGAGRNARSFTTGSALTAAPASLDLTAVTASNNVPWIATSIA